MLGHAQEHVEHERARVPPGSILVLSEECGMAGTIPTNLYSIFQNPDNLPLFLNPVQYKERLETLLQKPLKIYTEGQLYPSIQYILQSEFEDTSGEVAIHPSGMYKVPIPDLTVDSTKHSDARYARTIQKKAIPKSVLMDIYKNAIEPSTIDTSAETLSLEEWRSLPNMSPTQTELFDKRPGIYYNFLCRSISHLKKTVEHILRKAFPNVDMDDIFPSDNFDFIQSLNDWIHARKRLRIVQKEAIHKIQTLILPILSQRIRSGTRKNNARNLVRMLSMKRPPARKIMRLIEHTDIQKPEYHWKHTPLMIAALHGHTSIVQRLLEKGADVNAKDSTNETPLMYACVGGHADIAIQLLQHGADVHSASDEGVRPLHIACTKPKFEKVVRMLIDRGADPNVVDDEGDTPLHVVAGNNRLELVEILGTKDLDVRNKRGDTPLMVACDEGYEEVGIVFLEKGANMDVQSVKGLTAFDYALQSRNEVLTSELIVRGAHVKKLKSVQTFAERHGMLQLQRIAEYAEKAKNIQKSKKAKNTPVHNRTRKRCENRGKTWITTLQRCYTTCKPNQVRRGNTLRCVRQRNKN